MPIDGRAEVRTRKVVACIFAVAILMLLGGSPARAQGLDLFAEHQVTVQFATPDGGPMAKAEVRVFAPGAPNQPFTTGHTDADGKFEFAADRDGFWTAEARDGSTIARATVRVGGVSSQSEGLSPVLIIAVLGALLALTVGYRMLRAKARRPRI